MQQFVETLSVTGGVATAIVAAIVVVTLFIRCLTWMSGAGGDPQAIAFGGIVGPHQVATVQLVGGEKLERVCIVGYTSPSFGKGSVPYELDGMVILEDDRKTRFLVRAKNIKMIVVAPSPPD